MSTHACPIARRRVLAASLAALIFGAGLAAPSAAARADVRSKAAWSVRLAPGEWAVIPAAVCGGARPSDVEAWSVRRGRRVGDGRLFVGARPERIIGSAYHLSVRAFVWCDPGAGHGLHERRAGPPAIPWPMVRVLAVAATETRP